MINSAYPSSDVIAHNARLPKVKIPPIGCGNSSQFFCLDTIPFACLVLLAFHPSPFAHYATIALGFLGVVFRDITPLTVDATKVLLACYLIVILT